MRLFGPVAPLGQSSRRLLPLASAPASQPRPIGPFYPLSPADGLEETSVCERVPRLPAAALCWGKRGTASGAAVMWHRGEVAKGREGERLSHRRDGHNWRPLARLGVTGGENEGCSPTKSQAKMFSPSLWALLGVPEEQPFISFVGTPAGLKKLRERKRSPLDFSGGPFKQQSFGKLPWPDRCQFNSFTVFGSRYY
ncbi:Hypothetical predicted protein [Podarcis lilfordi]|uniref:Uncharacterized protein n=1 Tax=Podarcis lilfordi TaxID=74358 RepID=A0AA35K8D7_9SAUR|nr:Hypothetical predicted protein [Podarcis lilfordi]